MLLLFFVEMKRIATKGGGGCCGCGAEGLMTCSTSVVDRKPLASLQTYNVMLCVMLRSYVLTAANCMGGYDAPSFKY